MVSSNFQSNPGCEILMLTCCNILANGSLKSSTTKRHLERKQNELNYKYLNYLYSMKQNCIVSS